MGPVLLSMITNQLSAVQGKAFDVCVIGSGPVGLVSVLVLGNAGLRVLLLESGAAHEVPEAQALSGAEVLSAKSHAPMCNAVHRGLGGTSVWWGGRCVPLDESDLQSQSNANIPLWPLTLADFQEHLDQANQFLGAGPAHYTVHDCQSLGSQSQPLSERLKDSAMMAASTLERWSMQPNAWVAHQESILKLPNVTILTGHTCVGFVHEATGATVTAVQVCPTTGGSTFELNAKAYVLAAGGVESARLVLNSVKEPTGLKPLNIEDIGRCYMGHPSGKIATIRLFGDPRKTIFGFERDGPVYVRRRMTLPSALLKKHGLLNIAFWLDNPPLADASHGSGVLSSAYLGLTAPWIGPRMAPAAIRERMLSGRPVERLPHIWNCLRTPLATARFVVQFLYQRYWAKPRVPGFFAYSANNTYALHYHAEHSPNPDSRITLSDEKDALGLYRAKIDLKWSARDVDSILQAHDLLATALGQQQIGALTYMYPRSELAAAVIDEAVDGYHQIGTLRMGATPADGVTDSYGKLFGTDNLYIAGSALFPTSGQANPTLPAVALAIRQAKELINLLKR